MPARTLPHPLIAAIATTLTALSGLVPQMASQVRSVGSSPDRPPALLLPLGASPPDRRMTPGHRYVWPLRPQPTVARPFEPPPQPWAAGHRGVDLHGSPGQEVGSAGAGTVVYSGVIAGRGVVAVQHANGWRTTYQPLEQRAAVGLQVTPGQVVGRLTANGSHCAPGTCLHWGLLVAADTYRDPLSLLRVRHPILLPWG